MLAFHSSQRRALSSLLTPCLGALLISVSIAANLGRAVAAPIYSVVAKWPVGGDGGWDYLNVDPDMHRVYVSRGTHVQVLDENSGAVVGDIPGTNGVHGIAIASKYGHGFTSDGRDNAVTEFDLKSLKVIAQIPVGDGPDCIIYDPATSRVFTMNGEGQTSTAIDAKTGKVAGSITLGGRPEYAQSDGKGHVYVNLEDKSQIQQLDANKLTVLNTWPLSPGDSPSGLAMDRKNRRLFSVCHSGCMVVMDADTGKVIATPAIGKGPDAAQFDPDLGVAFSSNGGDGNLTIVEEKDPSSFAVAANLPTQSGARTMALDPKTHKIFVVTATEAPPDPSVAPQAAAGGGAFRYRRNFVPGSFVVLVVAPS